MTSTLQELGALHLSRPAAGASVAEIAAWHDQRASVLEHLAIEGSPTAVAYLALRSTRGRP
jgi:hypothetical protein